MRRRLELDIAGARTLVWIGGELFDVPVSGGICRSTVLRPRPGRLPAQQALVDRRGRRRSCLAASGAAKPDWMFTAAIYGCTDESHRHCV